MSYLPLIRMRIGLPLVLPKASSVSLAATRAARFSNVDATQYDNTARDGMTMMDRVLSDYYNAPIPIIAKRTILDEFNKRSGDLNALSEMFRVKEHSDESPVDYKSFHWGLGMLLLFNKINELNRKNRSEIRDLFHEENSDTVNTRKDELDNERLAKAFALGGLEIRWRDWLNSKNRDDYHDDDRDDDSDDDRDDDDQQPETGELYDDLQWHMEDHCHEDYDTLMTRVVEAQWRDFYRSNDDDSDQ